MYFVVYRNKKKLDLFLKGKIIMIFLYEIKLFYIEDIEKIKMYLCFFDLYFFFYMNINDLIFIIKLWIIIFNIFLFKINYENIDIVFFFKCNDYKLIVRLID